MQNIGVIGAGTMGSGIAQVALQHSCNVVLCDVNADGLHRAADDIDKRLGRLVEKGKLSAEQRAAAMSRLKTSTTIEALTPCELVIEAIFEDLDAKIRILSDVRSTVAENAILATNTSSLSVAAIGGGIGAASRVVGMHFFNPAPLMPLVEIVSGPETAEEVAERAAQTVEAWGKVVVRTKDTPGFIVNRVARGFYLEALRMLGEGFADIDEIDRAVHEVTGFRMGPFQLMDLVGIDVNYTVSKSVWEQSGRPIRLTPHPIQEGLYQAGQLGRKTGRGFYDYSTEPPAVAVRPDATPKAWPEYLVRVCGEFVTAMESNSADAKSGQIVGRILATIINEAGLALAEGVATAEHIDLAMKAGTNYPKGPLEWAAEIGYERVAAVLCALNQWAGDDRFEPAPMFKK